MNTVIRHIEYLISRKDCVIIPGIGAILAKYESARIDKESGLLLPPGRIYTFNKEINHNDGTLACSISRAESIRYELAIKKMESEIESMLHWLHTNGQLPIGRIGSLRYNKEDDTIQFETNVGLAAGASILLPAIKLGSRISFVSTVHSGTRLRLAKAPIVKKPLSRLNRFSRLAASIAIIMGVCFLAYQPMSHDNDEAMKASLAPAFTSHEAEYFDEDTDFTLSITKSEKYKTYSEIDTESILSPSPFVNQAAYATEPNSENSPAHYVVVASVRTNEEADRFLSRHSNEAFQAMPYKNLYVVYSAKCSDKNDAYKICRQTALKYPGAWICSK